MCLYPTTSMDCCGKQPITSVTGPGLATPRPLRSQRADVNGPHCGRLCSVTRGRLFSSLALAFVHKPTLQVLMGSKCVEVCKVLRAHVESNECFSHDIIYYDTWGLFSASLYTRLPSAFHGVPHETLMSNPAHDTN